MNTQINPEQCERCCRHNLAWMATAVPSRSMMGMYESLLDTKKKCLGLGLLPCPITFFPGVDYCGCSMVQTIDEGVPFWCPYLQDHK